MEKHLAIQMKQCIYHKCKHWIQILLKIYLNDTNGTINYRNGTLHINTYLKLLYKTNEIIFNTNVNIEYKYSWKNT